MPATSTVHTELTDRVRGRVLAPGDDRYDDARGVWNAMIDRRPRLVAQPLDTADVIGAVRFARAHGLELAIKGGGHNVAGHAATEGGLMLDLSAAMTAVRVDPATRTAVVEAGALLGDVDRETQAHGLATPAGFISSTGIAGLTLGGGFGYLSRKHGLTVDNLRGAELVTATGDVVRADADTHPDLYWAIRGGGGNFGVITSFEFDLHPLGPEVLAGPVVHTIDDAPQAIRQVAEAMRDAPDEVACLTVVRHAPPAPFIPEQFHGQPVVLFALVHNGAPADGEATLAPLRSIGRPIADAVAPRPYAAFQSMFDATAAAGARNYWKAHYLDGLTGEVVDLLCAHAIRMTSPESVIGMLSLGGQISRRPAAETAYPHRGANWVLNIQSRWREPAEDDRHIAWSRALFDAVTPHATGGAYVNFISGDEGADRLRAAYGDSTYRRLAAIKAVWDPDNVFHLNQNVIPAAG